ncbi:MAG: oligosaccharide flippase family protein [Anaerolineae bacterium]|nr:oligosaccharide flippase family protein [Anaerolineae bacterium]
MSAPDSPLTARLSRNTLALIVSNVGGAVVLFFLSALIGRTLGTDGLGVYTVAVAWVFPLGLLVEFGLGTLMTREIAQDSSVTRAYMETVTRSRLLLGGAAMLLLIAAAPLLSSDPLVVAGLHISAPLVIIAPFYSGFTAVFRARGEMGVIPYLTIGMLVAQLILTAAAFLSGGGVIAALIVNTVTSAGQLVAAWAVYRWKFFSPTSSPPVAVGAGLRPALTLLPLLRRAFPFALAAVFAALQIRLSVILLERLATTAEVGYFSAASRFAEAARTIPNAFFGALFPALALLAADRIHMARTFRRGMIGLGAFGAAAGVGFSLLGLPVIRLTYGDGFEPAGLVLQVLGWSLLFSLLRGGRTLYLYALGHEGRVNGINGAVIVVQGGLCLLLIPAAGAVGVALVHVLVEILALVLLWRNPPNARLTDGSAQPTAG